MAVARASDAERQRHAIDARGALIYPATVREVLPDGTLVLDYDHGGDGVELPEHVRPRVVMPWHPRDVPLHLMLRRNLGGGKVLEGLQVRWHYVSRLFQALCAFPRNGYGPWRLGGKEEEPMHKFYDPSLFDEILTEEQMRERYAPKVSEAGAVLSVAEAAALPSGEGLAKAVDVTTPEQFVAAGFSVHFSGSSGEVLGGGDAAGEGDGSAEEEHVEEEAFCNWLYLS